MIAYLLSLKLTLEQFLLGLFGAIIAFLVLALGLEGSELHKARISLLNAQIKATDDQEDGKLQILQKQLEEEILKYETAQ